MKRSYFKSSALLCSALFSSLSTYIHQHCMIDEKYSRNSWNELTILIKVVILEIRSVFLFWYSDSFITDKFTDYYTDKSSPVHFTLWLSVGCQWCGYLLRWLLDPYHSISRLNSCVSLTPTFITATFVTITALPHHSLTSTTTSLISLNDSHNSTTTTQSLTHSHTQLLHH